MTSNVVSLYIPRAHGNAARVSRPLLSFFPMRKGLAPRLLYVNNMHALSAALCTGTERLNLPLLVTINSEHVLHSTAFIQIEEV